MQIKLQIFEISLLISSRRDSWLSPLSGAAHWTYF